MQPFLIIHVFDEIRNSSLDIVQSAIFPERDLLGINSLHEALGKGVIVRVAFPRHADVVFVTSAKDSIWLLCQRQQNASKSPEAENDKKRRRRSDGGDCLGGRSCKLYSHADSGFRNTERELSGGLGTGVKKQLPDASKAASGNASLMRPSLSCPSIPW